MFPDAKIIIPVRDIRGVLSSLEKKFQKHPAFQNEMGQQDTQAIQTVEGRVNFWLERPPVGIAIQRIHEIVRLHKDRVHFVHAEDLAADPQMTMHKVWKYLGEEPFIHNTSNIEQYTQEHDLGWPYGDHTIRPKIQPLVSDWQDTLGRQLSEQIKTKFSWINEL